MKLDIQFLSKELAGVGKEGPAYKDRLEYELEKIEQKGLTTTFCLAAKTIEAVRSKGFIPAPGFSTTPCSLVAFALGISAIDPLDYSLFFERFIAQPEPVLTLAFSEKGKEKAEAHLKKYRDDVEGHIAFEIKAWPLLDYLEQTRPEDFSWAAVPIDDSELWDLLPGSKVIELVEPEDTTIFTHLPIYPSIKQLSGKIDTIMSP